MLIKLVYCFIFAALMFTLWIIIDGFVKHNSSMNDCKAAGGDMVRTYSGFVCAKFDVIQLKKQ